MRDIAEHASRGIAVREALMELLFVLVPLLVLMFVLRANHYPWSRVFASEEWSFASVILMGQAVAKYVIRSIGHPAVQRDRAGLVVAALIVLGLIPSVTILMIVLDSYPKEPSDTLVGMQLFGFAAAVTCFMWFGTLVGAAYHQRSAPRAD
jgi:hypothetical protein